MRISSPVNLTVLAHFKNGGEGYSHFRKNEDGSVDMFVEETCDTCGTKCVGANPMTFTAASVGKMVGLFLIAGLEPSTAECDIYANEEGGYECEWCPSKVKGA